MAERDREALLALEEGRCTAIGAGDVEALGKLLAEDYVHVHMNALVDDRAGHIAKVAANPRKVTRGALRIDISGDTACLYGPMRNVMTRPDGSFATIEAYATQVATRTGRGWRFVAMQVTRIGV
jgi:ketosteroid isomerase-like protein